VGEGESFQEDGGRREKKSSRIKIFAGDRFCLDYDHHGKKCLVTKFRRKKRDLVGEGKISGDELLGEGGSSSTEKEYRVCCRERRECS